MTPEEFKDLAPGYVAAGAAWLDENEPGWEGRIDLAELDLANSCRCVLGQLAPENSFTRALERACGLRPYGLLRADPPVVAVAMRWAVEHGFNAPNYLHFGCVPLREYELLDELWISLIKERYDSGLLSG